MPVPSGEILTAKISYGFDYLDADGNGRLDEHDHVLMGERIAAELGYSSGSAEEQQIIDAFVAIWRNLHLPNIPGGGTAITKEQFIQSTLTLADDPAAAQATVGALAKAFMAIADRNKDGRIGPAEYLTFLRGHFPSLSQADVDEAFAHLDSDNNGYLSADEFTRAIIEYWSSPDPDAPGNWWIGRPIYQR